MELKFRKGTLDDVELFVAFLEKVKAEMTQQEWFYLDPPELVRQQMLRCRKIIAEWVSKEKWCKLQKQHLPDREGRFFFVRYIRITATV